MDGILLLVRSAAYQPGALRILKDVYLAGGAALAKQLRSGANLDMRGYAGYCGWAPGQLAAEINDGDWLVVPADSDTVFAAEPEIIWTQLMKTWGGLWL